MKHTRREFLYLSGATMAALSLSKMHCPPAPRHKQFGIQLYTVRELFEKNSREAIRKVSGYGYNYVESYERNKDMFWGLGAMGFKTYVESLGMKLVSSHCDIYNDFERKAGEAASIGMKYLVCDWTNPQKTSDDMKKIATQFNNCGAICKKNGIGFAYHNHIHDFKEADGTRQMDIYINETDPALVDFQMDIFHTFAGGQDPNAWLIKYPERFKLCHVKDGTIDATGKPATCDLGKGSIDFSKILLTARNNNMLYYFAEQEDYPGSDPFTSARANAKYMRKLKF